MPERERRAGTNFMEEGGGGGGGMFKFPFPLPSCEANFFRLRELLL